MGERLLFVSHYLLCFHKERVGMRLVQKISCTFGHFQRMTQILKSVIVSANPDVCMAQQAMRNKQGIWIAVAASGG
ncbi:hypothetical protein DFR74_1191 [Nocardia puris]|uniref:Uncharacterized protein n=1 Tax=Nocardia puris TaxID=208602 RepID=A0A366D0P4_9NOCA|nr:hypothetical protein DFR74_1191 [Nocardia puris]